MDPMNHEVTLDASLMGTEKRKRGRPRKDLVKESTKVRSQTPAHMPSGFVQLNKTPRVDPINDPTEVMIGQTVTGVVEATFDAGYLLAVRIGNSNITLRGAVFKPGHTAPVTPENDVAPHAEMIRRTEVPFPAELLPSVDANDDQKRKVCSLWLMQGNGGDLVRPNSPSKGNYVLSPSVPSVGARGTVVPVVLQPLNLSNGLSANQPAPHLRAAQGKPVHSVLPLAVCPPNGSTSQASESQTSSQFTVTPTGSGNENASFKQTEAAKANKSNDAHDPVVKTEADVGDMNEPLFVEPLQTRHTVHHFQPPPGMGAVMHGGTGRMTELLQAVQQNIGDDHGSRNGHPAGIYNVSRNRDEETGQAGRM